MKPPANAGIARRRGVPLHDGKKLAADAADLEFPASCPKTVSAKIWSMGTLVSAAAGLPLVPVAQGALPVPVEGSIPSFLAAAALQRFATTPMGIFLATVARSMPRRMMRCWRIEGAAKPFLRLAIIGSAFFAVSLARFRPTITRMA